MIITKVTPARWQQAQAWEREISKRIAAKGDDWNKWWFEKFDGYKAIWGRYFNDVLEVGCGPNTNARLILPFLEYMNLWLEDPLMVSYMKNDAKITTMRATRSNASLENLPHFDASINLLICINVLDHVQDAEACMAQMKRVLAPHGVLIIGQDLSNEEDYKLCPESWKDVGHPIKLDHTFFSEHLVNFKTLYINDLPREQGRNPKCHFATFCWIGEKL